MMKTEVDSVHTALDDFKTAAEATFAKLKGAFAANGTYWQLGHAFDTVLDYFATVSAADAKAFGKTALARHDATRGTWWDDYGWWGIAGLKAYQYRSWFPELATRFERIAADCWKTMNDNAPHVWERRPDKAYFAPAEPRFPGGVWNYSWSRRTGDCQSDPGPCDPLKSCDQLCGFQNTVTNALYLVLASRLYMTFKHTEYGRAANREYEFLKQWFDITPPDDALLNHLPTGGAVV